MYMNIYHGTFCFAVLFRMRPLAQSKLADIVCCVAQHAYLLCQKADISAV